MWTLPSLSPSLEWNSFLFTLPWEWDGLSPQFLLSLRADPLFFLLPITSSLVGQAPYIYKHCHLPREHSLGFRKNKNIPLPNPTPLHKNPEVNEVELTHSVS